MSLVLSSDKLTEYFPPVCVFKREAAAVYRSPPPQHLCYTVAKDTLSGLQEEETNKKMTHFNKGPSYGLSAEVRSKVSIYLCVSGRGLLRYFEKLTNTFWT